MFPETSFYQSFIWGHDISLYPYGCDLDLTSILNKWNSKITKFKTDGPMLCMPPYLSISLDPRSAAATGEYQTVIGPYPN